MTHGSSSPALLVPDASLVIKWYLPSEAGAEAAQLFLTAFQRAAIEFCAPEHLKAEVARALLLGVRERRFTQDEGLDMVRAFLDLPLTYMPNDLLIEDAFRLASVYQMALYDALYVALAQALEVPFLTADRRLFNLAQQRGIPEVVWFEDGALPPA